MARTEWRVVEIAQLPEVRNAVAEHEERNLFLSGRLHSRTAPQLKTVYAAFWGNQIMAVCADTGSGFLLPLHLHKRKPAVHEVLETPALVRHIAGTSAAVRTTSELFGLVVKKAVLHDLMRFVSVPKASVPEGLNIRLAKADDIDSLIPLQMAYEAEDLFEQEGGQDPARSRATLVSAVQAGWCIAVWDQNNPVAMARLNARGLVWDQIAGVYTAPAWRRQGVAAGLISTFAERLFSAGRKVCLFVRRHNTPAQQLYKGLGLERYDELLIARCSNLDDKR